MPLPAPLGRLIAMLLFINCSSSTFGHGRRPCLCRLPQINEVSLSNALKFYVTPDSPHEYEQKKMPEKTQSYGRRGDRRQGRVVALAASVVVSNNNTPNIAIGGPFPAKAHRKSTPSHIFRSSLEPLPTGLKLHGRKRTKGKMIHPAIV